MNLSNLTLKISKKTKQLICIANIASSIHKNLKNIQISKIKHNLNQQLTYFIKKWMLMYRIKTNKKRSKLDNLKKTILSQIVLNILKNTHVNMKNVNFSTIFNFKK